MSDTTGEGEGLISNVQFTVIYRKDKILQDLPSNTTVGQLKSILESIINVPINNQKLILKGLLSDETKLEELKLTKASKIMVVGCTQNETEMLLKMEADAKSGSQSVTFDKESLSISTSLAEQKEHQNILERHGKPDDVMIGISNRQDPLPSDMCLTGMYDRRGLKIRVRINLDRSELILATKDRTQKVALSSIQQFVHCALPNSLGYEMVGFQLGPTEKSQVFVYWFPSQYIEAMRDIIMQHKLFSQNMSTTGAGGSSNPTTNANSPNSTTNSNSASAACPANNTNISRDNSSSRSPSPDNQHE